VAQKRCLSSLDIDTSGVPCSSVSSERCALMIFGGAGHKLGISCHPLHFLVDNPIVLC